MDAHALLQMLPMMIPKHTCPTVTERSAERAAGVSTGKRMQRGPEDSTALLQQEAYKVEVETSQTRACQPARWQTRQCHWARRRGGSA